MIKKYFEIYIFPSLLVILLGAILVWSQSRVGRIEYEKDQIRIEDIQKGNAAAIAENARQINQLIGYTDAKKESK